MCSSQALIWENKFVLPLDRHVPHECPVKTYYIIMYVILKIIYSE